MVGRSLTGLASSDPLGAERGTLARFAAPRLGVAAWAGLWSAAAVLELLALLPIVTDRGAPVTGPAIVLNLVGGSFAACGLIAWHRRPDSRSGALMTATGFAFFVPALLFPRDSSLAVTIASLVADLWILFFVPLILTLLTAGRLRSRIDWALEWTFIVPCVVLQAIFLLFSEQEPNLLAVFPDDGIANVIDKAQRGILVGACAVTAYVVGARWARASRPRRRALLPGVAGMLVLTLFAALLVNDLVAGERSQALLWIAACSLVSVPAAFLAGLLRSRLARGALADLMLTIRTKRGRSLETALAQTLHDPELVVAYRLPGSLGYADSTGDPVLVPPVAPDRTSAVVEHDGREIATLIYDASLDDDPELVEAVCAAAAIAIENERLQAESEQRVVELQASRERIVAAGDAERRRLERNLHDGAQQRLVAIALQLRLLQGRIRKDPAAAEELANLASDELALSLAELRELARGIHPAVLEHGLAAALEALATRAVVKTELEYDLEAPLPEQAELAAYFVASEALANVAKYAQASSARIRVWRERDVACIEIADDGIGGADETGGSGLRGLADRVEALEGTLRVSSPPGAGTTVTASLPCAS
jgi:signal transduction histidine kinase